VEAPNNKTFAFLQTEYIWLRVPPVRWVILLLLAPVGLWVALKRGHRDTLIILAIYAGFYSAANVVFFICDRYRYPVWPVMAAFAGGGVLACVETIRSRKTGQALAIFGSMAVLAALSLHNWFGIKLPTYARDYLFRSFASYEKGHFTEALDDINRSIELDPSDVNALHHRGNVLFALGNFEEARVAYETMLKLTPNESSTWNNLGATLDALSRPEEALRAFQRATECNPPSKNAFFGMALIQIRLNRLDDAVATVDRFDKQSKSADAVMLTVRAALARMRGDAAQAETLEQKARSLDAAATAWALEQVGKATKR
jgi:tetratricopeptide (TPR) repeat protein